MPERIKLGVSHCLLGEPVRYDGQHKRDSFIVDTLGPLVDFVPVCPEVECGLGVPREAMRLIGTKEKPRLVTIRSGQDITPRMQDWIKPRLDQLAKENLCGFIFKARSPSSGMERVKIYNEKGGVAGYGAGLFAAAFMERFPLLPVEEEGRLNDPLLRDNFVERIFTLRRYRDAVAGARSLNPLMTFHATHKYLLMAHQPARVSAMGQLLANSPKGAVRETTAAYEAMLLETLKTKTTTVRNINVLQHMIGYLKPKLTADEKQEFAELLADFRRDDVPLIAPIVMLRHYVRKYNEPYLAAQTFLYPHPLELRLRNHA
jgi:uncharacterized protein YbgA (DUF1722 family)/uncharacterized protein YbbK (DUF523 family)